MLALALQYAQSLQQEYLKAVQSPRCFYYVGGTVRDYSVKLDNNNGNKLQYVSLNKAGGSVIGYIECSLNRVTHTAFSVEAIRFTKDPEGEFSADLCRFVHMLFYRYGLKKMSWSVVVGNPAEVFYDFLVKTYPCFREVGVFKEDVLLDDGKLYDLKFYETTAEGFLRDFGEILKEDTPYIYRRRD